MEVESTEAAGERKRKRDHVVVGDGEEDDEEEVYEGIAEESVEELMRWLEMEISPAPETTTNEEPTSAAAAPPPGFVTINGNEESCGPSFSAAASTVMASVDTRAGAPPLPWPLPPPLASSSSGDFDLDDDEEWLAELLTGGPAVAVVVEDAVTRA